MGEKFADWSMKYMPDPYVFVIVLTVLAFLGALPFQMQESETALGAVGGVFDAWYGGVWTFLTFMAQFAVILMTGDAIAKSPAVTRLLERIAGLPTSRKTAVAFTSFTAMAAALISWGLGLIVGAVMARQVTYQGQKNGLDLHYPLVAAAGYTGLMIWHSGITSSSGLFMASLTEDDEAFLQYTPEGIPVTETIGSMANLSTVALLLIFVPLVMAALHPRDGDTIRGLPDSVMEEMAPSSGVAPDGGETAVGDPVEPSVTERLTPADRLNTSVLLTVLIAVFPAYYFINSWFLSGEGLAGLSLNSINAFFLFSAIVLWKTPMGVVEQMEDSVKNVSGIIFQFPFYAGISGIVTGTALGLAIANFFASISTPLTWPVLGLISTGLVNIFVPSGGGQWAAQGPILLETTQQLGMPLSTAVILEMMGDQLTNMVQPFWALPLLALADLRARDIIGYSTVAMLVGFVIMAVTLTVFLGLPYA
ncbi:TIGR00366 family protein [Halomarina ordinaria]|uniref:TIGR00366 family protein n=1 Tax=Halomarina ordinaria TaxID=3033939 RepID=A0ABD5U7Y4_9EURY|nr:TIGR00366 family protein [Halomarina sp. PSRA2]